MEKQIAGKRGAIERILWKQTRAGSFQERSIIEILAVPVVGIFIVWYLLRSRPGNNGSFGIQEYFSPVIKSPTVSIPNILEEYQRRPPGFQMMR